MYLGADRGFTESSSSTVSVTDVTKNENNSGITMSTTVTDTKYAPPTMVNPTIIDLNKTGGQNYWAFSDTQDVIFLGATAARTDKLQTQGGHNIAVLGGEYDNHSGSTGTLAFYGITGKAFVDGVHIDNAASSGSDGIDIAGGSGNGANTSLVVQNSSIINVNGAQSAGHADGIQTQGNVGGEVDIHNVHITTNYQGIFIAPQYAVNPSKVVLDNVDLHYTGPTSNDGTKYTYLLWTNDNPATEAHVPWSFNNVYVEPRSGQDAGLFTVWPTTSAGAVESGTSISWPSLGYTGSVTVGAHASFVDESQIGLHFGGDASVIEAAATGGSQITGTSSGSSSNSTGGTVSQSDFNALVGVLDHWMGTVNTDLTNVGSDFGHLETDWTNFFNSFHSTAVQDHWLAA